MSRILSLHDPALAKTYREKGLWHDNTLYDLLAHHAVRAGDAFAVRDSARRLTWSQLKTWTDSIASRLTDLGLREGDRVCLRLSNRVEAVASLLACARHGYVCNPSLHRNYTVDDVKTLIDRIGAKVVVAEAGYGVGAENTDIIEPLRAVPSVKSVWTLPKTREPGGEFPTIDGQSESSATSIIGSSADTVCYLAFTSGTTGAPKGVLHSSNTLLANARDLVRDWGHDSSGILLTLSPLSHHIAWVAMAQCLVAGMELVINDPPVGIPALDWVLQTEATYVMGVPTHAIDLLADQHERGVGQMGSVKVFYMAGSPIPRSTAQAFLDQGITPQNVYGMTENSSHQYTHPDDEAATIVESCGRGGPAYEVRVFDPENHDRELPNGQTGEIGGRGAALMLGYFDNQGATEKSFNHDGWFMSGDLGQLDDNGCLRIIGRLKDIIIRGGHNIFPGQIEDLAITHPDIEKAAAFAVADERLGEKVCLAVLPSADQIPDGHSVLSHLFESGLSKYDMPEYYLPISDLPLTASGKILKRVLADQVKDGQLHPEHVRLIVS